SVYSNGNVSVCSEATRKRYVTRIPRLHSWAETSLTLQSTGNFVKVPQSRLDLVISVGTRDLRRSLSLSLAQ
ncbi:hypothetical protein BaRGS_00009637, partial [Batillaria attramentaria]